MRHIDHVIKRRGLIAAPDMIHPLDGVATVRGDEAVEKIILVLERHVEATAGKRAGHRLEQRVRFVDGIILAPLNPVGNHIQRRDDLVRHKTAKVADDFPSRLVQFTCALSSFVIKLLNLFHNGHERHFPPVF